MNHHGYFSIGRRRIVARLLAAGALPLLATAPAARAATGNTDGDARFIARAEAMKRAAIEAGDQPYGAIVVRDGAIVGEAPSRVITNADPTAHAEMEAIRDAAHRLGTRDLGGCILFGTSRPCRMCETAAYWAQVSRYVFGAAITDGGAPSYGGC